MTSFALPKLCGAGRQGGSQDRIPVTLAAGQQRPGDRCDPFGQRHRGDLERSVLYQAGEPGPAREAGRPVPPDHRHRSADKQVPEIAIARLRDRPGPPLKAAFGTRPIQAAKPRPNQKTLVSGTLATSAEAVSVIGGAILTIIGGVEFPTLSR